jgi:hypothetical protein
VFALVDLFEKFNSPFAVHDNGKFAPYMVLVQGFAHETDIGGAVFYQKNLRS